jgi:hydrogenase maturation protease
VSCAAEQHPALLLGLGNPILGDDGVGLRVAAALQGTIAGLDVAVRPTAGLEVLDLVEGYGQLFVVDADVSGHGRIGTLDQHAVPGGTDCLYSAHGLNLAQLLAFGRGLGRPMPALCAVFGIGIAPAVAFREGLSPLLEARLPDLVRDVGERISGLLVPGGADPSL